MVNCKPGDWAVVVRCRNAPENVGAVRLVVEDVGVWPQAWVLDPPLPNGDDCICDTCLRPLRDSDGEDEMLRLAGKPQATEDLAARISTLREEFDEACRKAVES